MKITKIIVALELCLLSMQPEELFAMQDRKLEENIDDSESSDSYKCPLTGLSSFAILPQYSLFSEPLRNIANDLLIKELEKVGKVVRLKVPDVTGFGKSDAFLVMELTNISTFNDKNLPITQTKFNLLLPMVSKKTGVQCRISGWETSNFFEGSIGEDNKENVLKSIEIASKQFVEDYRAVNLKKNIKPKFYLYIP